MPIGKVDDSHGNFSAALQYGQAEGKKYEQAKKEKQPELIHNNLLVSDDYKGMAKEMREVAKENKRVKNVMQPFSINFDKNTPYTKAQQVELTERVIKEMGIKNDNHQYLTVRHTDKHPHYHIYLNRVGLDGKVWNDSHSKRRLEVAIDKVEKQMGIENNLAKTRMYVYDPTSEKGYRVQKREIKKGIVQKNIVKTAKDKEIGIRDVKKHIQKSVQDNLRNPKITNVDSLKSALEKEGISLLYKENVKGVASVSFKHKDYSVKGSAIDLKGNRIKEKLNENHKKSLEVEQPKAKSKEQRVSDIQDFKDKYEMALNGMKQEFERGNKNFDLSTHLEKYKIEYNQEKGTITHKGESYPSKEIERFQKSGGFYTEKALVRYDEQKKHYDAIMSKVPKEVPSKWEVFKTAERREALEYNERIKNEKQNAIAPKYEVHINTPTGLSMEMYKEQRSIEQGKDQDKKLNQEEKREQNQEQNQNRGQRL